MSTVQDRPGWGSQDLPGWGSLLGSYRLNEELVLLERPILVLLVLACALGLCGCSDGDGKWRTPPSSDTLLDGVPEAQGRAQDGSLDGASPRDDPGPRDVEDTSVDADMDMDMDGDESTDVYVESEASEEQDLSATDSDVETAGSLWPFPEVSSEPPAPCQAALDDPWYFQFLDNLCDEKLLPEDADRHRRCPVVDDSSTMTLASGGLVNYAPSSAPVEVDGGALEGILPEGMSMLVILVKRVAGVPHYRYLSTGDHDLPRQPWSTTKSLAIANAASALRVASDYKLGLTAEVDGVPVGDYVTSVHNYDEQPYASNSLGAWFHDIGGRARANDLIHELWLHRSESESFGGNYGDAAAPLGYSFDEPDGTSVTIAPDSSVGFSNHLSLFTLAEALKRLALHREEPSERLPGVQWFDLAVLFRGAAPSTGYGAFGGMSADTAIYLQMGYDIDHLAARSAGRWRVFSKLGLGSQGQFIHLGYACFPALDDALEPIPGLGREFVIAAHLDSGGSSWDDRDRLFQIGYRAVITRIVEGEL